MKRWATSIVALTWFGGAVAIVELRRAGHYSSDQSLALGLTWFFACLAIFAMAAIRQFDEEK